MTSLESLDAYQVVRRLRPTWLSGRRAGSALLAPGELGEAQVQVYVDGILTLGGTSALRWIPSQDLLEIRYLNSANATTRFGTDHSGGAILVVTRAGH